MADIRLILTDLQKELDVSQDRQFPLALNYTAGSLKDINLRRTNFSLELRIPANKQNKSALGHLNNVNITDGDNILQKTPCIVKADGIPIFTGEFKLMGVVNDRGHQEFKCILLGDGMDWAEKMKEDTLQTYDWGNFTINEANIVSSWSNTYTDGYTFPIINYGAFRRHDKVSVEDMRPAVFMRAFFEKAFNEHGYTIQTDTDGDFFNTAQNPLGDKIVFPFTGTNWGLDSTTKTNNTLTASRSSIKNYSWKTEISFLYPIKDNIDGGANNVITKSNLGIDGVTYIANRCYRFYIGTSPDLSSLTSNHYASVWSRSDTVNTPESKVWKIIDYGPSTYGTYVDLYVAGTIGNGAGTGTSYVINNGAISFYEVELGNGEIVDIDTSSDITRWSPVTDVFTAQEPIKMQFNADFKLYGGRDYYNTTSAITITEKNRGAFIFRWVRKVAATGAFEFYGRNDIILTDESNVNEYTTGFAVRKESIDSGEIFLAAGDTVWMQVKGFDESEGDFDYGASNYSGLYSRPTGDKYTISMNLKNLAITTTPQSDIYSGTSNLALKGTLEDEYSSLDYVKGCMHAFNLLIKTDAAEKKVIIKTRDNFYTDISTAVDWTDKVDLKKQYVIDYLTNDYKKDLRFRFKTDDGDAYLKRRNELIGNIAGEYIHQLTDKFEDGDQIMENPTFAYTPGSSMFAFVDKNQPVLSAQTPITVPRMWGEYSGNSTPPQFSTEFRPRLLVYEYEKQQASGQVVNFEGTTYEKIPTALANDGDLGDLDYGVFIGYNDGADDGLFKTYYEKTVKTIEDGTRIMVPMDLTFKDIQTLDITKPVYIGQPAEIRGYYIVDRIKNFLPSTRVTTTVELVRIEDFDSITIDSSQSDVIPDYEKVEFEGSDKISVDKGSTSWKNRSDEPTESQETTAKDFDQDTFVRNEKSVEGLGEVSGALQADHEPATVKKGKPNNVQSGSKNYSKPNASNTVVGENNIAVGNGQMIAGKNNKPSSNLSFAVGAGSSDEPAGRHNALSVDNDGIVREGDGYVIEEDNGKFEQVYEEVNGELVKVVI